MTVKIDGSNGLLQNYDFQTPTTGFSYTFTTYNVWFANPAGTLATGTITMPASPVDGMTVTITSTQQITALTINANTGQTIVAGGAVQLNANTNRQYMYRLANTTWYLQNIAAGNVVTSLNGATGAITLPGGINGQAFTSNGTFTIPTGVTALKVTVVGGGGGGGGAGQNACVYDGKSGGGAGGGGAISYLTGLTPGNTLAVTIGGAGAGGTASGGTGNTGSTGGTSTVASGTQSISTISGVGGGGGGGASGNTTVNGGTGGLGTGGTLNFRGTPGQAADAAVPGAGGSSIFGGGAVANVGVATGAAGSNYGGGGAGSFASGTSRPGGAGSAGVVIFEW